MDGMPAGPHALAWRDRIAEVRLSCGKANALNPGSLAALDAALDEARAGDARGVILTGYDRFFSAGLDLVSLYELSHVQMDAFMREFDRTMLRVFTFPRPVVAAINGHAIAGGCILALACDGRVSPGRDALVGLNEIQLGVPFPASAIEIARYALPAGCLAEVLYGGRLYPPADALARGLVDRLAPSDVLDEARDLCRGLAAAPPGAFETIKASLKAPAARRAHDALDRLRDAFVHAWFAPDARRLIGEARRRLGAAGSGPGVDPPAA
jgi:enoyl-CoA hydratase